MGKSIERVEKGFQKAADKTKKVTEKLDLAKEKLDQLNSTAKRVRTSKRRLVPRNTTEVHSTSSPSEIPRNGPVGVLYLIPPPEGRFGGRPTTGVHLPARTGPREVQVIPKDWRVLGNPRPIEDAVIIKDTPISRIKDLIKNIGTKKLYRAGLLGALGFGTYSALTGDSSKEENKGKETPQQYRYDPTNGWLEYNPETGQYENQLLGFGVDRFGNTNYYDGQNWLTPDLYIQGSNGYIYDKLTGLYIGTADDAMEAHNSGYDDVFNYRAVKAGYNSPEAVKQLQTQLGITADGKWGLQTLDAFDRAAKNWALQYDPNSLFTIYQRKMRYGY